jgi:hypothetical protein
MCSNHNRTWWLGVVGKESGGENGKCGGSCLRVDGEVDADHGLGVEERFSFILVFFKKIEKNLFSISDSFKSQQSSWHDSLRSYIICTGITHRAGACPAVDVAPRRPSRAMPYSAT